MALIDWFFPEQAEAMALRNIARTMRTSARAQQRDQRRAAASRSELEDDLGFLALVLMSLVGSLVEKGVIGEEELKAHLQRIDTLDGARDGKLTPDVLRGALGFARPEQPPEAPQPSRPRRRSR